MLSVINPDIIEQPEEPIADDKTPLEQHWEDYSEPESLEQTAFRLTWLASCKLQREYELIEPDLRKVIGDVAVWTNASHCVDATDGAGAPDQNQVSCLQGTQPEENLVLRELEQASEQEKLFDSEESFSEPLPSAETDPQEPEHASCSVMVTEIKPIHEGNDPFSDDEEEENSDYEQDRGADNDDDEEPGYDSDWSSDGETYVSDSNRGGDELGTVELEEADIADSGAHAACKPDLKEAEMWEKYTNLGVARRAEQQPQIQMVYS